MLGVVCYCENGHLLRHRSKDICASAIYYQTYLDNKALHCKAKHIINLRPDPTILDAGD